MRNVSLDTDVFAAIWTAREEGEETESDILRRILNSAPKSKLAPKGDASSQPKPKIGYHDRRNGVVFEPGFRIFRRYKGRSYEARAENQSWVRADNGQRYSSLNRLNQSIVAGQENVWNDNWFYVDASGQERGINELRNTA
jgi:hypothetical protein